MDKTDNSHINVYVSPIVHKGNVLGALFATVQTDAFIMSIDDRLFNGKGQVLVSDNQGTSCSGEAARSSSAATTISRN